MNCRMTGLIRMNCNRPSPLLRAPFSPAIRSRVARMKCSAEEKSAGTKVESVENAPDGVRCVVNEEGHLVCERLDPGDYVVRSTTAGSGTAEEGQATFCYITDDGQLLCEGLASGEYTIEEATDDDVESMLAHVESLAKATEKKVESLERETQEKTEAVTQETPVEKSESVMEDKEQGIRCFVTEEGHMVCERLAPGDYKVKSAGNADGATPKSEKEKGAEDGFSGETFCYITDDGQLLCEGLASGEYTIEEATDDDIEAMLEHMKKLENA